MGSDTLMRRCYIRPLYLVPAGFLSTLSLQTLTASRRKMGLFVFVCLLLRSTLGVTVCDVPSSWRRKHVTFHAFLPVLTSSIGSLLAVLPTVPCFSECYTGSWSRCNSELSTESSSAYQHISYLISQATSERGSATQEDLQLLRFCLGTGYLVACIGDNPTLSGQGFARSDEADRARLSKLCDDGVIDGRDPPEYRRAGSLGVTEVACTQHLQKFGLHRRGVVRYDACKLYEEWARADYVPRGSYAIPLISLGVTAAVFLSNQLSKRLGS
ncbi:hypothetical protein BESB_044750 [Besnoitia besnoiti]|uniref:Transmembrane protein n=1 Tax=Besnoitia besnoiti TaxID=94643 RepID=A0A2A9MKS3_BESBE|nr:hypothetical protein BESB_044750 [Besnoitia besnoiti]PFH36283.1 hypothetical protein BESB_044750 [Besnoitia besnoiti]